MAQETEYERQQPTNIPPSAPTAKTPPCRFLDLPAELRNRIYRLTLLETQKIVISDHHKAKEPGLLSACRQIRQETLTLYYHENVFNILIENHDSTTLQHWISGSKNRPMSNFYYLVEPCYNWTNLLGWVEATMSGRTGGKATIHAEEVEQNLIPDLSDGETVERGWEDVGGDCGAS